MNRSPNHRWTHHASSGAVAARGVRGLDRALGDEDDGDVEAPGTFDQVDGGAGPIARRRGAPGALLAGAGAGFALMYGTALLIGA